MSGGGKGNEKKEESKKKEPAGGYDSTKLHPTKGSTYTLKFTFHSATNVPVSDYGAWSSDPFILATLRTDLPTRHKEDPELRWRSNTMHQTVDPKWEAEWVVAGVPASGFSLKAHIYDEDPGDYDDRVGKFTIQASNISERWGIDRQEYKVRKSGGDVTAYTLRWGRKLLCRGVDLHARVTVSVEVLGKTKDEVGKAYTVNQFWWIHYSPMIGRLTGTQANDDQGVKRYE